MIIVCPSCTARYHVEAESAELPSSGRNLRCGRCGITWQAMPIDPPAEILPPLLHFVQPQSEDDSPQAEEPLRAQAQLIVEPGAEDGGPARQPGEEPADENALPAYRAARRSAASLRPSAAGAGRGKAFALGMLIALIGAGLHYRHDVVKAVPSSASLYELVGLPVNLRGLDFRNLESRRNYEDGLPVLVVEGEIVNLRDIPTQVPALSLSVRGEGGEPLYSWRVEPRQRTLEANARMNVRTRLAAPPSGARNVELRFDARQRSAGTEQRP